MNPILKQLSSVIGGETAVRAANFAAALVVARMYGASVLGVYAACIAFITVAVMFSDNGLQISAIADVSHPSADRSSAIGQIYISKGILLLVLLPVLLVIAAAGRISAFVLAVAAWVALRTILQSCSQLQMAILKAISKAHAIGVVQGIHTAFLFVGIGTVVALRLPLFALLAWLCAGQLLELILATVVLRKSGAYPTRPEKIDFWASMRRSTPLGITYGLANLIIRLDTIVLATLVSLTELGSFSAANTLLAVFYVVAWLFGSVLLPSMVPLAATPRSLQQFVNRWTFWVVVVVAPCALLARLVAPGAMIFLYGFGLSKSGAYAALMVLACPFILLNSLYTNFAIASNARLIYLGVFAATVVFAFLLDYGLGRAYGAIGVAIAIVIREITMSAAFLLLMPRFSATSVAFDCQVPS